MGIIVEKYEPRMQEEWDEFVDNSYNGTIFHKQRFLLYHRPYRFKDKSLVFKRKDSIISVFPAADIDNCLNSHPGTSFGGPVFAYSGIKTVLGVIDQIIKYAKDNEFKSIIMRLPPNIVKEYPIEAVEFALFYSGFKIDIMELGTCVPLGIIYPIYNHYQAAHKANKKGVCIRESNDFDIFWEILRENLKRHDTTPTHTIVEIEKLRKLFPNDIKLFAAYLDGKMISGTVIFVNNNASFETFYIAQNYEYQDYRSVNLLIIKVMEWATYHGYRFMNFGISTEDNGKKLNLGLSKFKEGFGGCDVVRKIYKMEL